MITNKQWDFLFFMELSIWVNTFLKTFEKEGLYNVSSFSFINAFFKVSKEILFAETLPQYKLKLTNFIKVRNNMLGSLGVSVS